MYDVIELVDFLLKQDIDEIALADSTGMGQPRQVKELMNLIVKKAGNKLVGLHLHNTENKGYANLMAGLDAGVKLFDTAFGGLGGCPFIKGATGNIATEDVVHMLNQMDINTGIDLSKVALISAELETELGYKLPGLIYPMVANKEIKLI
jgi:hydroxymethylglutaryl-CoA lyase